MDVKVKFLGGAKSVTGSRYLLDVDRCRILVDCGLFQGTKEQRLRNWERFPVNPSTIDLVLLTHAHIDHTGYLPRLIKEGFYGRIIGTVPTVQLVKILLTDSGKLQEEEAAYAQEKGYSKHNRPEPLYTVKEAEQVYPFLEGINFDEEIAINDRIRVKALNAGHILGAAIFNLRVIGDYQEKKLVFSGDLGRNNDPLLYPPVPIAMADILFMESTYGNRKNESATVEEQLRRSIRETIRKGGVAVIPSFAVGRTQLILYFLHRLQKTGKIPQIPIYVDSPMAIDVTNLYLSFNQYHKLGPELQGKHTNPFSHKNLHYFQSQEDSVSLNAIKSEAIIISASGMATGGRILHHLYNRLPNEKDSVIFVGFQTEGSRGRKLLDGGQYCRIYGEEVEVKASIYFIDGLSAHADQTELLKWASGFSTKPKLIFMVHGELDASQKLAELLEEQMGWKPIIPAYMESFQLFSGI